MIEIKTEKIWQGKDKLRKITNIKAIKIYNLPKEYFEIIGPCCFINPISNSFVIFEEYLNHRKYSKALQIGDTIYEKEFQKVLKIHCAH